MEIFFQFEPFDTTRTEQLVVIVAYSIVCLLFLFKFDWLEKHFEFKKLFAVGSLLTVLYAALLINVLSFDFYKQQSDAIQELALTDNLHVSEGVLKKDHAGKNKGIDTFWIDEQYFAVNDPKRNSIHGCYYKFLNRTNKLLNQYVRVSYLTIDSELDIFDSITELNGSKFCIVRIETLKRNA